MSTSLPFAQASPSPVSPQQCHPPLSLPVISPNLPPRLSCLPPKKSLGGGVSLGTALAQSLQTNTITSEGTRTRMTSSSHPLTTLTTIT